MDLISGKENSEKYTNDDDMGKKHTTQLSATASQIDSALSLHKKKKERGFLKRKSTSGVPSRMRKKKRRNSLIRKGQQNSINSKKRMPRENQLLKPLPEDVVKKSMSVYIKHPLYRQPDDRQGEMNYMVTLALTPLKDSVTDSDIAVISTHLSGLQPQLMVNHLAKGLLYFYIRQNCKPSLEKPLLALVRHLSASDIWIDLDKAVVAAIPDCLTAPDGPPAGNFEAKCLGQLGAWLCILERARGRLLVLLAEMLGRGGPRAIPMCIGALSVWPAVLGDGLLTDCLHVAMHKLADERPIKETKEIWKLLEGQLSRNPPPLEDILQKMKASMMEGQASSSFAAILLARIFGPRWSREDLVAQILEPIATADEDEKVGVPLAILTLGQVGRYMYFGRRRGRVAARKSVLTAIFDALELQDLDETVAESAVIGLVAFFGPGRPHQLTRALQRIPAAAVGGMLKQRLAAWCKKFLQPKFHFRKRSGKSGMQEEPEDNMVCNLTFPETLKELFEDDPSDFSDSECRFVLGEHNQ